MLIKKAVHFIVIFSLTVGCCQGMSISVKPTDDIAGSTVTGELPEKAGELRSGDARRASVGPHTSPAFSGYFLRRSQKGRCNVKSTEAKKDKAQRKKEGHRDDARDWLTGYLTDNYSIEAEILFYRQALVAARQLLLPSIKQPFKTLKPLFKKRIARAVRKRRGSTKVYDIEKERLITGICDVLRGMDSSHIENLLDEMTTARDLALEKLYHKYTIINNVRWSYGLL